MRKKIIIALILLSLFISVASAKDTLLGDTIKDDTVKKLEKLSNVPAELNNKISISGGDSSYSVTKNSDYIKISKAEAKDTHTKTKCSIDLSVIESLPGYNGKEFRVVRLVDGRIADSKLIKTKDVLKGKVVIFDATFSDVIISGVTGTYTKTVSGVNMLNTTIPFDVTNASLFTINITSPGTYQAWNQTNLSTYPGTAGKWLVVWPFNGNANDISGNSRHGTVSGSPSYATGKNGVSNNALTFDGSNDYVGYEYTNTLYSNAEMVWLWKTTSTSQGVIGEFRESDGSGRTAMYTTEAAVYLNNGTVQTSKWIDKADGQWNWAFYPFSPAQIDYVQIGRRYASSYYYLTATVDMAALYNGTLTADQRRKFTYGYQGTTIATNLNSTRIPITSTSQSMSVSGNLTQVSVQSNAASTQNVTLSALFTHDYIKVNEYDNGTHRIVEILYTPTSNITSGTLNYTLASIEGLGEPSITSNDSSADVELINNTLVVDIGTIAEGQTKYYDISMTSGDYSIIGYGPLDTTPSKPKTGNITFNVTTNGSTAIEWFVNDSLAETDVGTEGNYTYSGSIAGDYEIKAVVGSVNQTWILTVLPDALSDYTPSSLSLKIRNESIQQFTTMYTYPYNVTWLLDNVSVRTDNNTMQSAYWFNASETGLYNVTAKINESQVSWSVNVTDTPRTGLGDFADDAIIAAVVVVAVGYYWNRFRSRF